MVSQLAHRPVHEDCQETVSTIWEVAGTASNMRAHDCHRVHGGRRHGFIVAHVMGHPNCPVRALPLEYLNRGTTDDTTDDMTDDTGAPSFNLSQKAPSAAGLPHDLHPFASPPAVHHLHLTSSSTSNASVPGARSPSNQESLCLSEAIDSSSVDNKI